MRTENWQSNTPGLRLVGEDESGSASSPYGPMRAGLTTSHRIQLLVLSELLSSLENAVANLNSKSYTVLDTLNTATQAVSAALSSTQTEEAGTDEHVRRVW